MIYEKLNPEELALYEVLRNPVMCGEFLASLEIDEEVPGEKRFEYTDYQREFLLDYSPQVSIHAGRAVGKTLSLINRLTWHAVNGFFDALLFTVPNRSHLDPIFLGLQKKFRVNKLLQFWVGRYSVNSQQFLMKFLNNVTLTCRIAGTSGTGVNVVGLHVPIVVLDESAYYPWPTWVELQQVMNDWEPGHQIIVSGVPDGRREKSVLYQCSTSESYSKHHVSAYQNPRFTKEAEARAIEQFGGKESQDFIRQILGEHGTPTFALFDRENMRIEEYYYPTIKMWGMNLRKNPQALTQLVLNLPSPPSTAKYVVMGVDLGYTEPSMLIGLYQKEDVWYILFRVELASIEYNIQERFIDDLHHKYNFDYIGLDVGAGGQGKAVYNSFINRDEFKSRNYGKMIVPVEFGGTTVVGIDEEGVELKERVKPFSVTKLQEMVNSYQLVFSKRDEDLLVELERIVYTKSAISGQMVYKSVTLGGSDRGADHSFAALLTFVMILFEKMERTKDRGHGKLYRSRWLL